MNHKIQVSLVLMKITNSNCKDDFDQDDTLAGTHHKVKVQSRKFTDFVHQIFFDLFPLIIMRFFFLKSLFIWKCVSGGKIEKESNERKRKLLGLFKKCLYIYIYIYIYMGWGLGFGK